MERLHGALVALRSGQTKLHGTQVVVPGDEVLRLPEKGILRVGGGLQQDGAVLIATRPGLLYQAKNGKLWVESRQKRCVAGSVLAIFVSSGLSCLPPACHATPRPARLPPAILCDSSSVPSAGTYQQQTSLC